jgi:uncharacterized protein YbjT (DUF2867 family)
VAVADLDDSAALRRAFDGAAAVFAITTMTGPSGTDGEVAHGRAIGVPTVVIRPTFFMDNFLGLFSPSVQDGQVVLRAPFAPGVPLQMVAVADIGKAAATALLDVAAVPEGAVEIAGDERTPEAIADAFGSDLGLTAHFEQLPVDAIDDDDAQAMFRWFARLPAYEADMRRTRALVGDVTDFPTFVAAHPIGAV